MKWPLKRNKHRALIVDQETIFRNLAYDGGFDDPELLLSKLSPSESLPPSPEGQEMLRAESQYRLDKLRPFVEVIERQAMFGAASFVEMYARTQDLDDDEKAQLLQTYHAYSRHLLYGSLAGLAQIMEAYVAI